jgi:23S rRNA (uracil1939-C5)-methyltransferase
LEFALGQVEELNARGASARDYQSMLVRCNQKGEVSGALFEKRKSHPVMRELSDSILGREYTYSPNGFFQINLPVYEMALERIRARVQEFSGRKIIDMYSGVGTIGLSVAGDSEVVLVETNGAAFAEAEKNCISVPGARAVRAKSEEALEYIENKAIVILDPPRAGLDKKVVDKLAEEKPEMIIYLSCNPSTQARDVAGLLEFYELEPIEPFNFFPRTPHLETLVVLRRKND